jgi:hypothetical protein
MGRAEAEGLGSFFQDGGLRAPWAESMIRNNGACDRTGTCG